MVADGMDEELTAEQFAAVLRVLDTRSLFQQHDADGSGAIDAEEVRAARADVCARGARVAPRARARVGKEAHRVCLCGRRRLARVCVVGGASRACVGSRRRARGASRACGVAAPRARCVACVWGRGTARGPPRPPRSIDRGRRGVAGRRRRVGGPPPPARRGVPARVPPRHLVLACHERRALHPRRPGLACLLRVSRTWSCRRVAAPQMGPMLASIGHDRGEAQARADGRGRCIVSRDELNPPRARGWRARPKSARGGASS